MNRYRNIAFLAELLINILVFSVSCAILAGLFGQAGRLAGNTRSKSQATTEITALFETLRAEGLAALDEAETTPNGNYTLHYDKQWNPATAQNAAFTIRLQLREENTGAGVLCHLTATASDSAGAEICSLSTETYQSGKEGMA